MDILILISIIITSNLCSILLGAYIAWRCKENIPLIQFPIAPIGEKAEDRNKRRFDEILREGVAEF